jgi:hypothetical protein
VGRHSNIIDNVIFDYDYFYNYYWSNSKVLVENDTLYFNIYDSRSFNLNQGLFIFDVSDKNNIRLVHSVNITNINTMELYGNYLITAENKYLKVYNNTETFIHEPIYEIRKNEDLQDLLVINAKLIVRYWGTLQVIDLANITNPQTITNYDISSYKIRARVNKMYWSNNKLILSGIRTLVLLDVDLGTMEISPINNGFNILMIIGLIIIILSGFIFIIVYNTHKPLADKFVNKKSGNIMKNQETNGLVREKTASGSRVVETKQNTLASNFITGGFIVFIIQNALLILFSIMPTFFIEGTIASQVFTILFFVILFLDNLYALLFIIGLAIKLNQTKDNRYWIPIGCWIIWIGSSITYRFAVGIGNELIDLFLDFANGDANNLSLFYFMFALSSVALAIAMLLTVDKIGHRNLRFIATFYGIANIICNVGLLFTFFIDFQTISSPDIMLLSIFGFLGKLFGVTIIGFILAAFVIAENKQKLEVIKREQIRQ